MSTVNLLPLAACIRCTATLVVASVAALPVAAPFLPAQSQSNVSPSSPAADDRLPEGLTAGDWSSIRAAYEANRHTAVAVEGGHQARNPGQQWLTRFDGRGFTVLPDSRAWQWGLELQSFGFAGHEISISDTARASAAGQRVAYDWDATLQEWYVNDTRGLEHGYTVLARPPEGQDGPLSFTLAVRGELRPEVQADGLGVRFVNGDGVAVLTYAGLRVFDADGQVLAAHFQALTEGLILTVDERRARYPLTIDPIAQQAYLKASNTGTGDRFGRAVSVSGETVVVGAPFEQSNATGVNGDQSNNGLTDAGAAYVFVRSGRSWIQQAYLKASNTGANDSFGTSVAVSADTVVVGAHREASNATGVNGDQGNNSATSAGAAYVFARSGSTWSQQAYLKASNTGAGDNFGAAVATSGDTVVIGAFREASNATGVDGNQSNNSAPVSGAAYIFVRRNGIWTQQAYLKASNTGGADEFGAAVAVSGETIVVGASGEDSSATGVNGDQSNNGAADSGAAYVFARVGESWSQQAYLKSSNAEAWDAFGVSVSVSGAIVVVGAADGSGGIGGEDSNATGVNGDQADNSATQSGAAYVFVREGTDWSQQAYLKASNTEAHDNFGVSVAVSGSTVVVGAWGEDSQAMGVNGDQLDNSAGGSGAAYVFTRNGSNWAQQAYLKASNTEQSDGFGKSVSLSDDTVVIGAGLEGSNATGVNGDQSNDFASGSGAAYLFDLDFSAWTDVGSGLAGASGVPLLVGTGALTTGSTGSLLLSNAAHKARTHLFSSLTSTPTPFKGGTLVPNPVLWSSLELTSWQGVIAHPFHWPDDIPSGTQFYFQYAIQDAGAVQGVALSNALRADVP